MTGDPFIRCTPIPKADPEIPRQPINPCYPSPCGQFAECRAVGETPSCSCLPNYFGSPPNCRPECVVNTDCPSDKSCIAEKCRNPCEGSCGWNAECRVQNHIPICHCRTGYTGDPFTQCSEIPILQEPIINTPCEPSPCGKYFVHYVKCLSISFFSFIHDFGYYNFSNFFIGTNLQRII